MLLYFFLESRFTITLFSLQVVIMAEPVYDLLFSNCLCIDGTGAQPVKTDIAIKGDRIVKLGAFASTLATGSAKKVFLCRLVSNLLFSALLICKVNSLFLLDSSMYTRTVRTLYTHIRSLLHSSLFLLSLFEFIVFQILLQMIELCYVFVCADRAFVSSCVVYE